MNFPESSNAESPQERPGDIEVTAPMIEAGLRAWADHEHDECPPSDLVLEVYRSMEFARRKSLQRLGQEFDRG